MIYKNETRLIWLYNDDGLDSGISVHPEEIIFIKKLLASFYMTQYNIIIDIINRMDSTFEHISTLCVINLYMI